VVDVSALMRVINVCSWGSERLLELKIRLQAVKSLLLKVVLDPYAKPVGQ
jgi:hypothetical protein